MAFEFGVSFVILPEMRTSSQKLNPSFQNQIEKTLSQTLVDLKDNKEAEIF